MRDDPEHQGWLDEQLRRQLAFGAGFPHPDGGASWLDETGRPDLSRPVLTWITARMAHVYSLGELAGIDGCWRLADLALKGLTGPLHDPEHGGWFASVGPGRMLDDTKSCYATAFVQLAAATATQARRPGAAALLDEAVEVLETRFRADNGLYADSWDRAWTTLRGYRGVNANMHVVEADLAAAATAGDAVFLDRALTITERVVDEWARGNQWRVPEHFDAAWNPLPDHHREQPDHPF